MSNVKSPLGFWKTSLIYGALAGALVILMMLLMLYSFGLPSYPGAALVSFLQILFVLSLLFFGMKRFRNIDQAGSLKFSKALLLGLIMSLVAGLAYASVSEIYIALTGDFFIQTFTDYLIEQETAKGVSGEDLATFMDKMEILKENYAKPGYRIPRTFMELFPMAFIVSFISALILHRPKFWARRG